MGKSPPLPERALPAPAMPRSPKLERGHRKLGGLIGDLISQIPTTPKKEKFEPKEEPKKEEEEIFPPTSITAKPIDPPPPSPASATRSIILADPQEEIGLFTPKKTKKLPEPAEEKKVQEPEKPGSEPEVINVHVDPSEDEGKSAEVAPHELDQQSNPNANTLPDAGTYNQSHVASDQDPSASVGSSIGHAKYALQHLDTEIRGLPRDERSVVSGQVGEGLRQNKDPTFKKPEIIQYGQELSRARQKERRRSGSAPRSEFGGGRVPFEAMHQDIALFPLRAGGGPQVAFQSQVGGNKAPINIPQGQVQPETRLSTQQISMLDRYYYLETKNDPNDKEEMAEIKADLAGLFDNFFPNPNPNDWRGRATNPQFRPSGLGHGDRGRSLGVASQSFGVGGQSAYSGHTADPRRRGGGRRRGGVVMPDDLPAVPEGGKTKMQVSTNEIYRLLKMQQQKMPSQRTQYVPLQSGVLPVGVGRRKEDEKPTQITIKQTVKQIQGSSKGRKKKPSELKQLKKEYRINKKALKSKLSADKKSKLSIIKKLPKGKQNTAKSALVSRYKKIIQEIKIMPKTVEGLRQMLKRMKTLKL